MASLRNISFLVTLFLSLIFLFLSSQIKADSNLNLVISLLESGKANALATDKYISEKIGGGDLSPGAASAFPICAKWYAGILGDFSGALSYVNEKNFESARDIVQMIDSFAQNCAQAFATRGVQDAQITKSTNTISDTCRSAEEAIDKLVTQPPV